MKERTKIEIYISVVIPTLTFASETKTTQQKHNSKITVPEKNCKKNNG